MTIEKVFAHLVYPNFKDELDVSFTASEVPLSGKLFGMIKEVYDKTPSECDVEIKFRSENQSNEVRDSLIKFFKKRSAKSAGKLAKRLALHTTGRSKIGLFFVILGKDGGKDIVVLSRFPTDSAILADEKGGSLTVEFLEKVFVRKWSSYKGAYFTNKPGKSSFWSGWVVDRQINAPT